MRVRQPQLHLRHDRQPAQRADRGRFGRSAVRADVQLRHRQLVYKSLIANGYRKNSGVPVTLIGYSGGGQMACAAAPYLKRALDAPVDVISLGGVISGNDPILELEHLYHFVGDKDKIERHRAGHVFVALEDRRAVVLESRETTGPAHQISLGPGRASSSRRHARSRSRAARRPHQSASNPRSHRTSLLADRIVGPSPPHYRAEQLRALRRGALESAGIVSDRRRGSTPALYRARASGSAG